MVFGVLINCRVRRRSSHKLSSSKKVTLMLGWLKPFLCSPDGGEVMDSLHEEELLAASDGNKIGGDPTFLWPLPPKFV